MFQAIGVIEFISVARGIQVTDKMLKAAKVELVKTSTVCPGKYITIICGNTASVHSSMQTAINEGGEFVADTLELDNVHPQVIMAIAEMQEISDPGAIGVMEFYTVTSGIMAADRAVKAASVDLVEIRLGYAIGGKGLVVLSGDIESVKTSVKAGVKNAEMMLQTSVIARPEKSLIEELM